MITIARMFRPAALVAGLALVCLQSAAEPVSLNLQPAQLKSLGIETEPVQATAGHGHGDLPAKVVVPNQQIRVVAAPVAGMVEALLTAPGETVKSGQVVARLASPEALGLQRDYLQAGSQTQLAEQNLARDEQLFKEGLIAESRLQATRAAAAQARAQLAERRQGLAMSGVAPGKVGGALELRSPMDGVVLEQATAVGQRVEASTLIYRIARLSPLWLEIQVPVALAATLKPGTPVQVAATGAAGRLLMVGRAVDGDSQSVLVRALIDKGTDNLRPGQAVAATVTEGSVSSAALSVPAAALVRQDKATVVFVQGTPANGQGASFEPRPVRVLGQAGERVLVDGVKPGERLAVKGVSGLKAMWMGIGKN